MGPRQIVAGKLGSAALQMLVYLSAISPCLAFTYMLRGIDFPTILMVLCYTVLASLGLSVIGLFLGTLTSEKHLQVILTVIVVIGLLLAFWAGCALAYAILDYSMLEFNDVYFWLGNAAFLTGYASYFALVFYAAAARAHLRQRQPLDPAPGDHARAARLVRRVDELGLGHRTRAVGDHPGADGDGGQSTGT